MAKKGVKKTAAAKAEVPKPPKPEKTEAELMAERLSSIGRELGPRLSRVNQEVYAWNDYLQTLPLILDSSLVTECGNQLGFIHCESRWKIGFMSAEERTLMVPKKIVDLEDTPIETKVAMMPYIPKLFKELVSKMDYMSKNLQIVPAPKVDEDDD